MAPKTQTKVSTLTSRITIYLIITLIAQSFIIYGALHIFDSLPPEYTGLAEDYKIYRDIFRGPSNLISERLTGNFEHDQQVLNELQHYFTYPLQLIPSDTELPNHVKRQFISDTLAFDDVSNTMYLSYGFPNHLLQIGPLVNNDLLNAYFPALLVFVLVCSIISAIIFFCLLFFALLPLWRDAISLRTTAEQLAAGDLSCRSPQTQSWLFKPLSKLLNQMADKIERQVHNSKIILHAMAHELRTPVARLRFGLTILADAENQTTKDRQLIGINKDIGELESLINTSLNFFKMQQQAPILKKEIIDLPQWSEDLYDGLQPFQPERITFSADIENTLFAFDHEIVSIAVNNLLLNGFKYASSQVALKIWTDHQRLMIEVNDDGIGIPLNAREEIFTPFSRLDNSRTRSTGGHGLGLAYAKLIAEYHGGSIKISENQWNGARFTMILK